MSDFPEWEAVRERVQALPARPRTVLLTSLAPLSVANAWQRAALAAAGATLSDATTWAEIAAFAPEVVLVVADDDDALEVLDLVDAWWDLPAVPAYDCYAITAAWLAEPKPETAQLLATILHPETFTELVPPFSVRLFPDDWMGELGEGDASAG